MQKMKGRERKTLKREKRHGMKKYNEMQEARTLEGN